MLAKSQRFDFRTKLPKNSLSFPSFNIRYDKNNDGGLKVGVVVSKKVDKHATVRNRLKRVLLENVRLNIDENEPLTLVFYLKKEAIDEDNLKQDFEKAKEILKNV